MVVGGSWLSVVMENGTDWGAWHEGYGDERSPLSRRLRIVQHHLDAYLDETAPAPISAVSVAPVTAATCSVSCGAAVMPLG